MTKRPSIASLAPRKANAEPAQQQPANPPEPLAEEVSPNSEPAGRRKQNEAPYKAVLSKVDNATHRQMKILALDEGVPVGDLQIEALNLLFRSRGLPEIATRVTPDERGKPR